MSSIRERNAAWSKALRARSVDPLELYLQFPGHGARASAPAVDRYRLIAVIDGVEALLRVVIDDAESQHPGGWGPDVTTVAVLRDALGRIESEP